MVGGNAAKARWFVALLVAAPWSGAPLWAKKTHQPVYEDPFDIAGGGASLTRASGEAILIANPAQLRYNGKFHRWLGTRFSLLTGQESVAFAQSLSGGGGGEGADQAAAVLDAAFSHPIHVGVAHTLGWINEYFGVTTLARFEPDIRAREMGRAGIPEVAFQAEGYGGVYVGGAQRVFDAFSIGLAGKYLGVAEPDIAVDISDQEAIAGLASQSGLMEQLSFGQGAGLDVGALLFLQGSTLDLRLAGKVDDVGGTKISGTADPFRQTISAGMGLTLHTDADAIHIAADVRDLTGEYGETIFKKTYAGVKLVTRKILGVAAGYYQGYPSVGLVLDPVLFRLSVTAYTREYGTHPGLGIEKRGIYVVSLGFGF